MIPSRPLFLGDLIGHTFVIALRTWTRSAIVALLLMIVPVALIVLAANSFIDTMHSALEKKEYLTPEKLEHFRERIVKQMREDNPALLNLYGIDKGPSSMLDTERSAIYDESFDTDARQFFEEYDWASSSFVFLAILAYILMIVASLGYQVVAVDLACRAFEERSLDLRQAVKDTFRRNLWVNIAQFLILIFILAFGLGVAAQVGEVVHPTLGAGLVLAAVVMTIITALRLLFAQPALVSESLGPLAALKRSWEITHGNSLRIFGVLIIFAFIIITIYIILSIPFAAITSSSTNVIFNFLRGIDMNASHLFTSLKGLVLELAVLMLMVTAIFASFSPSFLTVLYYDLRTRKDGPLTYEDEGPVAANEVSTTS